MCAIRTRHPAYATREHFENEDLIRQGLVSTVPLFARPIGSLSKEELFREETRLSNLKLRLSQTISHLEADDSERAQELVESLYCYYREQDRKYLQIRKAILVRSPR